MAFRYTDGSCVAVGTFNIYVVQPTWLGEIGILATNQEITIENNLSRPGFRLRSPAMRSVWVVSPSRLVIESKHSDEDCGSLVAAVLQHLKWTPVTAVGNNSVFRGPAEELRRGFAIADSLLEAPLAWGNGAARNRSISFTIPLDGHVANINALIEDDQTARLHVNVHSRFSNVATNQAVEAARRYREHRKTAADLVRSLFNVEVSHDVVNA